MESMSFSSKRKNRLDKSEIEKIYFNTSGNYSRYRSEERRLKLKEEMSRKTTVQPTTQERKIYYMDIQVRGSV